MRKGIIAVSEDIRVNDGHLCIYKILIVTRILLYLYMCNKRIIGYDKILSKSIDFVDLGFNDNCGA